MSDSGALDSASAPAAAPRPDSPLADRIHPSPNHGERRGCAKPDSLILHYTGMAQTSEALLWLANPLSQVSCHYFVFEDGRIWQMVPENRRAWHAGRSSWHGETDMNSRSIGIEIANVGHDLSKAFASEVAPGSREANAFQTMTTPPNPGEYPHFLCTRLTVELIGEDSMTLATVAFAWSGPDVEPSLAIQVTDALPLDDRAETAA